METYQDQLMNFVDHPYSTPRGQGNAKTQIFETFTYCTSTETLLNAEPQNLTCWVIKARPHRPHLTVEV